MGTGFLISQNAENWFTGIIFKSKTSCLWEFPPIYNRTGSAWRDGSSQRQEVFDLEIIPVNQFPHFD